MKKIIPILILLFLFCNNVFWATKDIDIKSPSMYSLSNFSHNYIIKMVLAGYKWQLTSKQSDTNNAYNRYIQWNPSKMDLQIKEEFCHWDNKCIVEQYYPAIKWNSYLRDTSISFYTAGVQVFQNKVDTLSWTAQEVDYIKAQYGQLSYDWIMKNKDLLDKAFDRYIEKERTLILSGSFTAIQDLSYKPTPITTYYGYVYNIGWKKLENIKNKVKSNLDKAKIEYFQYRLIWDERLYIKK